MMIRPTAPLVLIAFGLLVPVSLNMDHVRNARAQDDAYEAEIQKGQDLIRRRLYDDALKSFKRANEMRDKKSAQCFELMAEAYLGLEAYKNVIESAEKAIELAGGDKQLIAKACNSKGLALQISADKKDLKKLRAAEDAFRQALAQEKPAPVVRYNLGVVLLQLNRDPEGIAELKQFIQLQHVGQFVDSARKLIENPRRARENYAPDFSFTSLQGQHISLEDLRGKVVVLDFWGTWCRPCVDSVPELRNMHKRYSKQSSFMLIGISSDGEEDTWKKFTERNKMVWPQYRDKDRRILRAFGVRAFPSYFVIDHEGIVRYKSVGASWDRAADLDEVIEKYIKIASKTVAGR